jgi:predicted HAD superfamily Cof-like phosphohydrolase
MIKQIKQVKEFNEAFRLPIHSKPCLPNFTLQYKRIDYLQEELNEFSEAVKEQDIVEIADAVVDQLYIIFGTAILYGFADKLEALFDEVHRSNMTKLDENGEPIYNKNGKVAKSDLYEEPDLKTILEK